TASSVRFWPPWGPDSPGWANRWQPPSVRTFGCGPPHRWSAAEKSAKRGGQQPNGRRPATAGVPAERSWIRRGAQGNGCGGLLEQKWLDFGGRGTDSGGAPLQGGHGV